MRTYLRTLSEKWRLAYLITLGSLGTLHSCFNIGLGRKQRANIHNQRHYCYVSCIRKDSEPGDLQQRSPVQE